MSTKKYTILCLALFFLACGKNVERSEILLESNLSEITVTADKLEVFLGDEVTFNISGRADFLTFYSGEDGKEYRNNPTGGVEHRGKIDVYTYVFKEEGEFEVYFLGRSKNGEERAIGPIVVSVSRDTNPLLNKKTLAGGMAFGATPPGSFQFDLGSIFSYNRNEAILKQAEIDFFIVWSGSSYPVFLTPAAGLAGWAVTRDIRDTWTTFNPGVLIRLDAPSEDEIMQFESLERRDDLMTQFDDVQNSVTGRPGYAAAYNGPGLRVDGWGVAEGDLIYFKSDATGRDLYAAFRITSIDEGTAGQNGSIEMEVKSILYL